ncbi:transcription elongation factor GreA [bacterium]|nr:transcription elongation factor GreA [bacterium]
MGYISKEKYEELKKELERLENEEMKKISLRLKAAEEEGDLSENAAYAQAREDQQMLLKRISELKKILKESKIVETDSKRKTSQVQFGSKVKVKVDGQIKEFKIVGPQESNPKEGLISNESPLGKALMGKKANDEIELETPAGKKKYLILEVS